MVFVRDTKPFWDRPNFAEVGAAIGIVCSVGGYGFSNALTDPGASRNCAEQHGRWSAGGAETTGS